MATVTRWLADWAARLLPALMATRMTIKDELFGVELAEENVTMEFDAGELTHAFSDNSPEDGFEQVAPDLEDVFFSRIALGSQLAATG